MAARGDLSDRWSCLQFTCTDCEWTASGVDDDSRSPSKRAIEHHVDCGHHIERIDDAFVLMADHSTFRSR
ncbi:hypothetical protein [Halalkalicoccus sp. NIPERK01]|uniref:hypothetical protein n=1 Tax=Halalkalicoccus sp. NIPERK01 TaxID=3053469 RepID=UPI00256F4290|nr:hypothetical protein [Halalkalicoccus sp. NIPERK01]MDL5363304.1 hypothetical protein [Halalkalicoccus sp. NIPERK01]